MPISNVNPTYDGTVARLPDQSSDWRQAEDDQSSPPNQGKREGNFVYHFDAAVDPLTAGTHFLRRSGYPSESPKDDLPIGFLITGGVCDVETAVNGGNESLNAEASQDLIATGATLNSTGLKNLVPDPSTPASGVEIVTANLRPSITLASDITTGKFTLILKGIMVNG